MVQAPVLSTATELAQLAVDLMRQAGCDYGDIRVCETRQQQLMARDRSLHTLQDNISSGFGVRVLVAGAWGFAASPQQTPAAIAHVVQQAVAVAHASRLSQQEPVRLAPVEAHRDTYVTPIVTDPFAVPLETKAELVLSLTEGLLSAGHSAVTRAWAQLSFSREAKVFASTEGALIDQTIYRSYPAYGCMAVGDGDAQSRSYERSPLNCGYEHIDREDLLSQVERVAAEAAAKLQAPDGPASEQTTLILLPTNLYLTIHESVGHPTELDRVFGYEANFAGTSFATTDQLGSLRYAAPWVNFVGDRTLAAGRSTVGYDDEGVKAQRWPLVQDGILVDYLTDRETAYRLGRATSNGCAFADSWASVPMVRIPNLSLEPGAAGGSHTATLAEMIADTESGILIDGLGSFSIDQQRRNFQFGGDAFWRIERGQVTGMLKNVTYHSQTTEFWNQVDALGDAASWQPCGTNICGKGEPLQFAQMTHGCVPVRVRDIRVGRAV
ncbi:MAG: TldD/PmbA family protein [Spirulinaceae cyanobacterium RM2_2_10]|nr:TldD/PmbA family protein [Spirulinaceae cyanobacterium SM2_1_0]NJO19265.1 TldD/PmbA family protein [Spirulinaceae cyanobacterium RM2_2_10]